MKAALLLAVTVVKVAVEVHAQVNVLLLVKQDAVLGALEAVALAVRVYA